jgi:Protein of unknown function (DUF3040)
MSLSAREQEVLNSIRDRLVSSDPDLARLLGTFTWLAATEEMPGREQLGGRRRYVSRLAHMHGRARRGGGFQRAQRAGKRIRIIRIMIALWFLVTVALLAVAAALSSGSKAAPGKEPWTTGYAVSAPATWNPAHAAQPASAVILLARPRQT